MKSQFNFAFDGKLGNDAVFTANPAGDATKDVTHLTVWVDESYPTDQKDANGKTIWTDRTLSVRVTCWAALARKVKDAKKFQEVAVFVKDFGGKYSPFTNAQTGKVSNWNNGPDTYQAQDGTTRASWEVVAQNVVVGPIQTTAGSGTAAQGTPAAGSAPTDVMPF